MELLATGVPNLDECLGGGIPVYSLNILAGRPGSGKTILAQNILFNVVRGAKPRRALYMTTLSEAKLKVVRYIQNFGFFDGELFGSRVVYEDLGEQVREQNVSQLCDQLCHLVDRHAPDLVVIDSFKAIRDLASSQSEFRLFCYDLAIRLAAKRCTTLLLGEYTLPSALEGAEFVVADGILYLDVAAQHGEQQRQLHVLKMRGVATDMSPAPFAITADGVRVLGSHARMEPKRRDAGGERELLKTGVDGLDALLCGGIPRGRSVTLSGASGSGKTTLAMQFLVQGAAAGDKGLMVSFEESPDRLRQLADGFGWNLEALESAGRVKLCFIPQTAIRIERDLDEITRWIETMEASRVVIDSLSVFLHRVRDPGAQREKTFQLTTLVQRAGAVGLFISDIPSGETQWVSRFGVEETVADGTIVLSYPMRDLHRARYLEVLKMRSAPHVSGRRLMEITSTGIEVLYSTRPDVSLIETPPPLEFGPLQSVLAGAVPYGSAWLVESDPGIGMSAFACQFAMEGLKKGEGAVYFTSDATGRGVEATMRQFGFDPTSWLESGQLSIVDLFELSGNLLEVADASGFLFTLSKSLSRAPKPLRAIFDSLQPLALGYPAGRIVELMQRKIHLLRRPDVCLMDTILRQTLEGSELFHLVNSFDIVVDLTTPEWGDLNPGRPKFRTLRVAKTRGMEFDGRPYPYTITPEGGIELQREYYSQMQG